jgi:hypothetical protein
MNPTSPVSQLCWRVSSHEHCLQRCYGAEGSTLLRKLIFIWLMSTVFLMWLIITFITSVIIKDTYAKAYKLHVPQNTVPHLCYLPAGAPRHWEDTWMAGALLILRVVAPVFLCYNPLLYDSVPSAVLCLIETFQSMNDHTWNIMSRL